MQGASSGTSAGLSGRGGTVAAVGTMAAIALVAVSVFVVFARLSPAGQRPPEPRVEQVPTLLADGSPPGAVPPALPSDVQGPVIGVRSAAQPPPDVPACDPAEFGFGGESAPVVQGVRVTPEVVLLDVVTDPLGVGTQRVACVAWRQGGAWMILTPVILDQQAGTSPFGYFCCDDGGKAAAGVVVQAPEGTRWVLQERPGWWLAYPVDEHLAVPILWSFRQGGFGGAPAPASHVLYLDGEGEVLDEAFLRV
ncbi:MAG: hypothetical protein ACRD0K_25525 [Egibacteraceae bacterium]